jgi:hypothetical protein
VIRTPVTLLLALVLVLALALPGCAIQDPAHDARCLATGRQMTVDNGYFLPVDATNGTGVWIPMLEEQWEYHCEFDRWTATPPAPWQEAS